MKEIFQKIKDLNVLIVGDIMLDKYYFTTVNRISPEAPIPVAKLKDEKAVPGGAANAALNVSALGTKTHLIGRVGEDKEAKELTELFSKNNINFHPIITADPTITKTRIVSGSHQLIRLDKEADASFSKELDQKAIKEIEKIINDIDIIIVSDYIKGMCGETLLEYFKTCKKYVSIDTKPSNRTFKGYKFITPNFKEAKMFAQAHGIKKAFKNINEDVEELGTLLKDKLKTEILLTRSSKGASFIGKEIIHDKAEPNEVADVSGAGDTCIAIFSILDYLGVDNKSALEVMNASAKISVSKLGTYAPTIEEIEKEVFKEQSEAIIPIENVGELTEKLRKEKKKIVLTNGCFDLLNIHHVTYLNESSKQGDILIVGVNSDKSVKTLKGEERPIIDEMARAFMLSNLKCVDYVVIFEETTADRLVEEVKPDIYTKGGDLKSADLVPETPTVRKFGGEVKILSLVKGDSTTSLIKKIKE